MSPNKSSFFIDARLPILEQIGNWNVALSDFPLDEKVKTWLGNLEFIFDLSSRLCENRWPHFYVLYSLPYLR